MRKTIMFAVAAVTMTITSCGNKTEGAVAVEDSLTIDTVATLDEKPCQSPIDALNAVVATGDSDKITELINQAVAELNNLTGEDAKAYAMQLQKFIEENKAKLEEASVSTNSISELVDAVVNLPESALDAANAAKEAAKSDAQKAADEAKAATQQKAEELKSAAEQKANEAVDAAARKATNAVDKAAASAKKSLGL